MGIFSLSGLLAKLAAPPFGLYYNNYYGLALGLALGKYQDGYYCGDVYTSYTDHDLAALLALYLSPGRRGRVRDIYIFRQSEKQLAFARRLLEVFPYDGIMSERLSVKFAIMSARVWCEKHIHLDTVERWEPKMFEILNVEAPEVYSKRTEEWADWLTAEKAVDLKQRLPKCDERFLAMLTEKYGEKRAQGFRQTYYMPRFAVGWLHKQEDVDERVERYMTAIVCRECGVPLSEYGYQVYENGIEGQSAMLTRQNVINLNKKLLGSYQNEFFCLSCLCEVLECTEWELYEKMQDFKLQGCELF